MYLYVHREFEYNQNINITVACVAFYVQHLVRILLFCHSLATAYNYITTIYKVKYSAITSATGFRSFPISYSASNI